MEPLFIIWSGKYETRIPILDEQYRGLVSLINSFFFHRHDADKDLERILIPTAEMFKAYARINFYTVEKLLRDAEYPSIDFYVERHQEILENIIRVERRCRALRDAKQFLDFLKDYWAESVKNLTGEYISFLRDSYWRQLQ